MKIVARRKFYHENHLNFKNRFINTIYNDKNENFKISLDFRHTCDIKSVTLNFIYIKNSKKYPIEYVVTNIYKNKNEEIKINVPVIKESNYLWKVEFMVSKKYNDKLFVWCFNE